MVVGIYVDAEIYKRSVKELIRTFTDSVKKNSGAERSALQVCKDQTPKTWSFGIFADSHGNISSVQDALHNWSEARCLGGADDEQVRDIVVIDMVKATDIPVVLGLQSGLARRELGRC